MAWDCSAYYDYLFDRTPHFDDDILTDWFPTDDAWIGQVATGEWPAFTGTEHTYDRVHVGAPDLSQEWDEFAVQGETCVSGACAPNEICIGWGSTRKTYKRYRKSYTTNVMCFDQIDTRAKAKEQMAQIVKGIKEITKMVQSDYLRRHSLMDADNIYICGSDLTVVPITAGMITGACTQIDLGAAGNVPTSNLTVQYLQRFYEPLQFEGYFKSKYVPNGMFKLITDPITSQQLTSGNPALTTGFRFTDFQKGGEMFKYGISSAVGNFGISWDGFPMRFDHIGNGVLRRVFPYVNEAATIGIKRTVATAYVNAPIQYSPVWHPEAMRRLTPNLKPVHPEMPFLTRDLAGKWRFCMDPVLVVTNPVDLTTCTIDNKRRNQGLWYADFEGAIKFERPELVRGILHLREPGCVVNDVPCTPAPDYAAQDYSSCNDVCEEEELV